MRSEKYIDLMAGWFKKFKRYKVSYKNGYFNLFNLANSPYTVIETFDNMPFCKHNRAEKLLTTNTLFITAQVYYSQPEEELCVLVSDLRFKKNLLMSNIYDKSMPMDYHLINLHFGKKSFASKSMIINGFTLTDKTWSVFKAGNEISDYHFKNSDERNITIYFTSNWLKKNAELNRTFKNSKFFDFFESDNQYLLLDENDSAFETFYDELLLLSANNKDNKNNKKIGEHITHIVSSFIAKLNTVVINENHFKLTDKDRRMVQKTEKYLMDNLLLSFPGIETTAKEIGVSPTKLKNDFKSIHNKSLYQYYSFHQMQAAYTLFSKKSGSVKEVAQLLGYENASKFTDRFKEQFGVLPSKLIQENTSIIIP
jgi:AraC-like DNA-binding protein